MCRIARAPSDVGADLISMDISPYSSHIRLAQATDSLRDTSVDICDILQAQEKRISDIEALISEKTGGRCTDC